MKRKTWKNILMILCLLSALGCGAYLVYYYMSNFQSEQAVAKLRDMVVKEDEKSETEKDNSIDMIRIDGVEVQSKFESLYRANRDFIGWIQIEDTKVNYPVMFTPNDAEKGEFYIHRDFEMNDSASGLPFVDKNCVIEYPTDNIIIYGHNMNAGTMFHDIIKYADQEFYNQHKTFSFDTIYGDGTYEVVAAFYGEILPDASTEFKYYEFVNAGNEEEFMYFVENVKQMSAIETEASVEYGDKLITLSTCAYHVEDGRFAVVAKKIK